MLEWNVYYEDFNGKKIESFNIFENNKLIEDCKSNLRKNKDNKEEFINQLKKDLMYYYWSKCEWEILLTSWIGIKDFKAEKIDVYDQIKLNWNRFVDYVWENKKEFRKN